MRSDEQRPLGRPRASDQTQPTTESITEAATQLFTKNGYQTVSVNDVAKQCNVTKATIYYYFPSKAELFTETMVQMMIRIRKRINAMLHEPIPLKSRLYNITKTHLSATVDIDINGFMKGTTHTLSPEQLERINKAEMDMYQSIEQVFTHAMEQKEIREINPVFATHAYLSLLKVGNYNNEKQAKIYDSIDEMAEQIIELFWEGVQIKES
ncbi:TetR/AcrR family transcriptional regulator [Virgibacillus siamensis]|uniref:TetR/AcrR family transcriptional regulator n=1 Tax=Virgibacillus siamensis TaxID=480071 RepID=A0ABP3QR18_9BACI